MIDTLAARLRRERVRHGWTLRDLAQRAKVSNPLISQIETGHAVNPGIVTVAKLARALDRSPGWLAWGSPLKGLKRRA